MGQREVYEWLRMQKITGFNQFFFPKEIEKGLRQQGLSNGTVTNIRGDCFRLFQSGNGCLEMKDYDTKGVTNWLKAFRIKDKSLESKIEVFK